MQTRRGKGRKRKSSRYSQIDLKKWTSGTAIQNKIENSTDLNPNNFCVLLGFVLGNR